MNVKLLNKLEKEFNKYDVNIYNKEEVITFNLILKVANSLEITGFQVISLLQELHNHR